MAVSGQKPAENRELVSPYRVVIFMFVVPLIVILVLDVLGIPTRLSEWAASLF